MSQDRDGEVQAIKKCFDLKKQKKAQESDKNTE